MTEKYYVVRDKELKYDGYFNCAELYYLIDDLISRLGYDKVEKQHDVKVFKSHREIEMKLYPEVFPSDYVQHVIEITIKIRDMVDVTVKDGDVDKPIQYGKIFAKFHGLQYTNYRGQWANQPTFYLIRTFIDKFVYPDYMGDMKERLKSHVELFVSEISAYLNTNKYRYGRNQSAPAPTPRR